MDNEVPCCGVCSMEYNIDDRVPRILVDCGHTLCSRCLINIVSRPNLRKCPFDNKPFKVPQNGVEAFPYNFALKDILEERTKNLCQVHRHKASLICLTDKCKICHECVVFGDHAGHQIRRLKEVKDQGYQKKKKLEDSLEILNLCQKADSMMFEERRSYLVDVMKERFSEIKLILQSKELEWTNQAHNIFSLDKNTGNNNTGLRFGLKKQINDSIKQMEEITKTEDFVAILDQDITPVISKLDPIQLKEHSNRVDKRAQEVLMSVENLLTSQKQNLLSLELPTKSLIREMCIEYEGEEPKEEVLKDLKKTLKNIKFRSRLEVEVSCNELNISVAGSYAKDIELNLHKLKDIKEIKIELGRYEKLVNEDLSNLYYILNKVKNVPSLCVVFETQGISDDHLIKILPVLFCQTENIQELIINLENCNITDRCLTFLFNKMLPKVPKLKEITLHLHSTHISNSALQALAKNLSLFKENLSLFSIGLYNVPITDEGIIPILSEVNNVKALELQLQKTKVTNRLLKTLSELMSNFAEVKEFTLHLGETKVSDEGVIQLLMNLKDLKGLKISLFNTSITDSVVETFRNVTLPQLKSLECLDLEFERTKISGDNLQKIANLMNEYDGESVL